MFLINPKYVTVIWLFKMENLRGSILNVLVYRTVLAWQSGVQPHLKVHQLYEIAICTNSQAGNEKWQLMSKFVQFTSVHISKPKFLWQLKQHEVRLKLLPS